MMFNKILVIVDEHVDIHNYKDVAEYLSMHVNPATDIYLSQGPMDVLDHSCSKFAFGGKMCVDATLKFEEEKSDGLIERQSDEITIDVNLLQLKYPEIHSIHIDLLKKGISVVAISVEKNRLNHIKDLNEKLFNEDGLKQVKFIIYVDYTVDASQIDVVTWHFANNIDPKRDVFILSTNEMVFSHAGIDGTRKTKAFDNFHRPWPNIIVMDDETIKTVDEKWSSLGLGEFIPSPSLKYKRQVLNGGAVVEE